MQQFQNNWSATLALPAAAADPELTIEPAKAALLGTLSPGDHYAATLARVVEGAETAWEVVHITAITGGVLTVLRGQEGTTALDWEAGEGVSLRVTKGTLEAMRDNVGVSLSDDAPAASGVASPGTAPAASRADHVHPAPTAEAIGAATSAQGALAVTAVQPGDLAPVATSGSYDDLIDQPFIPTMPGDIGAATSAQGALADSAVQPATLTAGLAGKVDKEAGKGLSPEEFTSAEKAKLAGLEAPPFKGTFLTLAALEAAHPTGSPGDYADVDAGAAAPVLRYIWDNSDSEWVAQAGSADPITAAQVKTLYESNPDTNAFTDTEKSKLGGVAANATANPDTDSLPESGTPTNKWFTELRARNAVLAALSFASSAVIEATDTIEGAIGKLAARLALAFNRANHTGTQAISTVTGLQTALDAKAAIAGLPSRTITTSGAVTPADAGHWLICDSATPITLTIGAEATESWAIAGILPMFHILQVGAGAVTITGDGFSVTLHATDTNVTAGAGSAATAIRRGSNSWSLIGRLVAA